MMAITVEATYENGTLKLEQPLPLPPHAKVRITVHTEASPIMDAYGIMGWTGDAATVERVALDPEFDVLEE
jgi:predicted DNA-binding antitoxin AbrB/MazE fold protein